MPPRNKPRGKSNRPESARPRRPARRTKLSVPWTPVEGAERLQKVLAAAGIAGRRECEQLILDGRVEVDRKVVTELGTRVDLRSQDVRVDGEALARPKLVYFAVNKPDGVVSTSRDPAGRPRVIDLLPPDAPRAYCVGRLDRASEGLILVTNDGELANGLTHPRHGVEKVYQVQVAGRIEQAELQSLRRGSHLSEGFAHVKNVRIKNHRNRSTVLEMVLDEGRNREIRRMLAKVGHKVQRLTRIAVGPVRLGELPVGAVRMLTREEVVALKRSVGRGRDVKKKPAKKHVVAGAAGRASIVAKPEAQDKTKLERRIIQ
jgi:23S rRNA pseudouridine2605 synthase